MQEKDFLFVGTEEECRAESREIDFDGDDVEKIFNQLLPEYQSCVYRVLLKLAGEGQEEHFGCNFKQLLDTFKEENVDQSIVINEIVNDYNRDRLNEFINDLPNDALKELSVDILNYLPKSIFEKISEKDKKEFPQNWSEKLIKETLRYVNIEYLKKDETEQEKKEGSKKKMPIELLEDSLDDYKKKLMEKFSQKSEEELEGKLVNLMIPEEAEYKNIEDQIHRKKDTKSFIQDNKEEKAIHRLIKKICKYYQVDLDILINGIGKYISVKEEWNNKFIKDDKFFQELSNIRLIKNIDTSEALILYEKYLKENDRLSKNESIFIEKYATLRKTGLFYDLKRNKTKKNQYEAIITLIRGLEALQKFGSKGIKEPDEFITPSYIEI